MAEEGCLLDVTDTPALVLLVLAGPGADLRVVVMASTDDIQDFCSGPVPHGVTFHRPLLTGAAVERLKMHSVTWI